METVKFIQAIQQIVFQEYVDTVKVLTRRVLEIDEQIAIAAHTSVLFPLIEALMALRGINLLMAVTIVAETGGLQCFTRAQQLMPYLGSVPSEHSSSASKTAVLQKRAERTTDAAQEISLNAQKRLCGHYRHILVKGKLKVQACTAVARELAGFVWAVGQAMPRPVAQQ